MGSGSSKPDEKQQQSTTVPPVVLGKNEAMSQDDKDAALRRLEEDFYREAYNQGQKHILEGVNTRSDQLSDVKTAEKLSDAEADRQKAAEESLEQLRNKVHSLKVKATPCQRERQACLECYRSHGATDPLKCEEQLRNFEKCTAEVSRKLLVPSERT